MNLQKEQKEVVGQSMEDKNRGVHLYRHVKSPSGKHTTVVIGAKTGFWGGTKVYAGMF